MKKNQIAFCLMLVLFCFSQLARGQSWTDVITGPSNGCVGSITAYTVTPTAGYTYDWSVDVGGNLLTANPSNPASFQWTVPGTSTVKVVGHNPSGLAVDSGIYTVTVCAVPAPFIATYYRVACQNLDSTVQDKQHGDIPEPYVLSDADGCIKVCAHTRVTYLAYGPAGSSFNWVVTGGMIIGSHTSSTVVVQWGAPGTGNLSLECVGPGPCNCIGYTSLCIDIIPKPHASFAIAPNTGHVPVYYGCIGTTLVFTDLSTYLPGSPLVSWFWNFGDGSFASDENPTHTYTVGGTYNAYLVVANACGCTDTSRTEIIINELTGPTIVCPHVVCQNDTCSYTTTTTCGTGVYSWNVVGGTIVSGMGTPTILVQWAPTVSGFGYVELYVAGCASCPETTSIKIPIVESNPVLTGPTGPLCINTQVQYSIPLWPGVQYDWGLIGDPSAIISFHDGNVVTLEFTTPGTYMLHGWWESRTNLCGGDLKYKIIVNAPPAVVGPDTVCTGVSETYSLSPTGSGHWVMHCPAPTPTQTGTGGTFTGTFPVPGIYTLTVSGSGMCTPPPVIIYASPTPLPPGAITGPVQVCFGQPVTYTATTSVSGSLFAWSITAGSGTFTPSTGNTVTVIWTAPGTITVQRQGLEPPFCLSSGLSLNVMEFPLTFSVTGNAMPCANSTWPYTDGYTIADATTWAITPTTAGSVVTGIYDPNCTIQWNNTTVALTATVTATAQKCGMTIPETMTVNILPAPINSITASAPPPYCNGQTVTFTDPALGAGTYSWDFGDGGTGSTNPASHTFNTSASGFSPIPDVITLITTGSLPGYCSPTGVATSTVSVIPGPYASISPTGGITFCTGSTITTTLNAVVTNCGSPVYQWYYMGSPVGTSSPTYVVPSGATGTYYLEVSDASVLTACPVYTNTITVSYITCGTGGCSGPTIGLTYTVTCNAVHVESTGPVGTFVSWNAAPGYTYYNASGSGPYILDLVYPPASDYNVELIEGFGPCYSVVDVDIPVPLLASYHYSYICTNPYTLHLVDESGILAPFTMSAISWASSPPLTIPSTNPANVVPTPGIYDITETITVSNGTQITTCTTTQTVNVPTVSSISFTDATSPICEGVPIAFTETVGGSSTYGLPHWTWGDGSDYVGSDPSRTYTWATLGSHPFNVTVAITNGIGCPYSATNPVTIWHNNLKGTVTPATPDPLISCGGAFSLYYTPDAGTEVPTPPYLWSDGTTFDPDAVSTTGSYFVTVSDPYQCQYVTEPQNVVILGNLPLAITGLTEVCYPNAVHLSGFVGTAGFTYQWWRTPGGLISGATGPTLTDVGLSPGTYTYWLVVTNTFGTTVCTYTSATYSVTVNTPPTAPTVTETPLSCSPYEVELTASSGVSGAIYTWSTGASSGATCTLTSGGSVRTWLFDPSDGCSNYTDTYVSPDPGSLADWIPTGCYTYCNNFVLGGGLTLYGPPGPFDGWEWLNSGTWDGSGTFSDVSPLTITGAGDYQLSLTSGGCTQVMGGMDVTLNPYCQCPELLQRTTIICDPSPGNPAGYQITFYFNNPGLPVNAVIGMDIGPLYMMPINIPSGASMATYNFTTFDVPPPASTNGWIAFASATGTCYEQFNQPLPTCTWVAERGTEPQQPAGSGNMPVAMLVFPNPAQGQVTVSYNYGSASATAERRIVVYDIYGRTVASQPATEASGSCLFSLSNMAAGVYLVKMEENGRSIELQRLTVTH